MSTERRNDTNNTKTISTKDNSRLFYDLQIISLDIIILVNGYLVILKQKSDLVADAWTCLWC